MNLRLVLLSLFWMASAAGEQAADASPGGAADDHQSTAEAELIWQLPLDGPITEEQLPRIRAAVEGDDLPLLVGACRAIAAGGPLAAQLVPALAERYRRAGFAERRIILHYLSFVPPVDEGLVEFLQKQLESPDGMAVFEALSVMGQAEAYAQRLYPSIVEKITADAAGHLVAQALITATNVAVDGEADVDREALVRRLVEIEAKLPEPIRVQALIQAGRLHAVSQEQPELQRVLQGAIDHEAPLVRATALLQLQRIGLPPTDFSARMADILVAADDSVFDVILKVRQDYAIDDTVWRGVLDLAALGLEGRRLAALRASLDRP